MASAPASRRRPHQFQRIPIIETMFALALRNRYLTSAGKALLRPARQPLSCRLVSTESKRENQESPENNDSKQPAAEEQTPLSDVDRLTKQLEEKDAEITNLNDKILRVLAEMENVRMIARRDVDNAKTYAITPFAKAMLTVADNMGLAMKAVPESVLNGQDSDPQIEGLLTGMGAIESELLKVFSQHGIHRFGDVGDKFDPNKYQAMFEAPSPDHEPGTVMNVTKIGYTIGERVLRPAEVGVSKSP